MSDDLTPSPANPSGVHDHPTVYARGDNNILGINQEIRQYIFDQGFLPVTEISDTALAPIREGLYVAPRSTENWDDLPELLAAHGVLVLVAPPGTGRRTTALHLLSELLPEDPTVEFWADWDKPEVKRLPSLDGHGCVLDLSSINETPDVRFGQALAEYGGEKRENRLLVVLTTPETWRGQWTEGTHAFTVELAPPDARELVRRRLLFHRRDDLLPYLDSEQLKQVWQESLRAGEATELSDHLLRLKHPTELDHLKERFTGWRARVEKLLTPPNDFDRLRHGHVVARSVVWSGALHEGCRTRSVILGSEDFLATAGVERESATVFAEPTSRRKLELAEMTEENGLACFKGRPAGLDQAILNHLWRGYPKQHPLLNEWIRRVLESGELNSKETALVARRVLNLAVTHSDTKLLDSLRSSLGEKHRPLAVELFTDAALSPSAGGSFMRLRLYNWAKHSDPETLALVSEICGGKLGVQMPKIALTRLTRVAENAPFGFAPLQDALSTLLAEQPRIAELLDRWLWRSDTDTDPVRLRFLLALAHSDAGPRLLLGDNAEHVADPAKRKILVSSFRRLISSRDSGPSTQTAVDRWGELEKAGHLGPEITELLVDIYDTPLPPSVSAAYRYNDPYWRRIWDRIVERNLRE